ncbi:hypothetical protein V5799_012214 [Amblyomma americanum]|uniref:Uncharacterized protein n=1 Tax=Amblyomma americanum TaxID=6943 RepID=A0AAQ4EF33_AMBAM
MLNLLRCTAPQDHRISEGTLEVATTRTTKRCGPGVVAGRRPGVEAMLAMRRPHAHGPIPCCISPNESDAPPPPAIGSRVCIPAAEQPSQTWRPTPSAIE